MEEHRKKKSVFSLAKNIVKLTALTVVGVTLVAPTAIIAIVVRACTGGKDITPRYEVRPRDKTLW